MLLAGILVIIFVESWYSYSPVEISGFSLYLLTDRFWLLSRHLGSTENLALHASTSLEKQLLPIFIQIRH